MGRFRLNENQTTKPTGAYGALYHIILDFLFYIPYLCQFLCFSPTFDSHLSSSPSFYPFAPLPCGFSRSLCCHFSLCPVTVLPLPATTCVFPVAPPQTLCVSMKCISCCCRARRAATRSNREGWRARRACCDRLISHQH